MYEYNISDEEFGPWANNATWLFTEKNIWAFHSKYELMSQLQKQDPTPQLLTNQRTYVKRANFSSEYASAQVVYQVSNTASISNVRLLAFIFADNLIVTIATGALLQPEYKNNPVATKSKWRQIDNLGFLSKHVNQFQGPNTKHPNKLTEEEVSYLTGSDILTYELRRIIKVHQGQIRDICERHRKEKEDIENQRQQLLDVNEGNMLDQLTKKCSELEEENAVFKEENSSLKRDMARMEQDIKALQFDCRDALKRVKVSDDKKKALTTIMTATEKKTKTADEVDLLI